MDIIEVEQMRTHTIIIHIPAQVIQMVMGTTKVIIHHHLITHQLGIHQAIMIMTMIMDIRMTTDMITRY